MKTPIMNTARGILTMLSAAAVALSCGGDDSVRRLKSSAEPDPDQILIRPRIVISENGVTNAVLRANTVKVYEDSSYTLLQDSLTIFFYNEAGEHTSTLKAMNGEVWGLYEEVDSLRASGNVTIVSEEREALLEAPGAIRWLVSDHRIFGEGLVRLQTDSGYEEGTGFTAKDDLSEYEFTGPVSGEVRSKEIGLEDR